ncbi:MAG TPA: GGDEF domain-containing protein [Pilimelia sp.]|nr:GGDEF domain-containing protein [Pilimelia sp.]
MRAGVWRWYLGACVAGVLLIPVVGGDGVSPAVYLPTMLATLAAVLVGVWRYRPAQPGPWRALAAFLTITLAGDVAALFPGLGGGWTPTVPLPDLFYSAAYAPLLAAVLLLVRHRSDVRDRTALIDAAIIAISVALLAWVFVVEPTARQATGELASNVVTLLSPFADVLMMALLVRMAIGGGARNAAITLLTYGFVLGIVGDTTVAVVINYGIESLPAYLVDMIFLLAYACFGASALHPSMPAATQRDAAAAEPPWGRRRFLLATASLLAPVVLLAQSFQGDYRSVPIVAITCIALFLLVVARMSGLVRRVETQARRLDLLAHTDGLTRVPNRRAWDAVLRDQLDVARRTRTPLHVALLDLDRFKQFNDTNGHQAGDEVLRRSAEAWRATLRSGDVLARYGGEEFAVLITGGSTDDAVRAVDRLRTATPLGQTFSAGVATWDTVEPPTELLARADDALYAAKQAGRDRVQRAGAAPQPKAVVA